MFFRQKPAGPYRYIQIVENHREGGKVRQRALMTVGRLDVLQASGQMDALIRSGMRFCEKLAVIDAAENGAGGTTLRIGPDLVFGRLWEQLGIQTERMCSQGAPIRRRSRPTHGTGGIAALPAETDV